MKTFLTLIALAVVPLGLSAQTKTTTAKKPVPAAVKTTTTKPAARPAATTARSAAKPAPARPTSVQKTAVVAQADKATKPAATTATQATAPAKPQSTTTAATAQPQKPARTASVAPVVAGEESRFRIGFRVGGNASTFGGVNDSQLGGGVSIERVMGFHGGLVINIGGPKFSVQPEILYSQYGFKIAAGSEYLKFKYNMVEVPILAKASFGKPGMKVFVNAGPVVSYVLNGTMSYSASGETGSQPLDMKNEGRVAYGAAGGLGISLAAGPGRVSVEGRYNYLMNGSTADGTKLTPQNAMLSVSYQLPLGGR
ncbi:porin family protein [Tellurirhabdus rosea]|uniref:porin family protein n=1 Tax=Tellurirhabdus rosea TaxID=2674997 RepID=UPI002258B3C5|nr:porin family protein [Tellurirhabdus rosea]